MNTYFRYTFFFLLLITLMSACKTKTVIEPKIEEDLGLDSKEIGGIKLFTSLSGVSRKMKQTLHEQNIKRAIVVNGGAIDNPQSLQVDKEKIKQHFDKILPNPNIEVLLVLDIEGEKMKKLEHPKNEIEFDLVLSYYIDIYRFAKKLRPKATIGFYGFPWRDYWNRTEQWKSKNNKLTPLIKEVDAVFPSLYDFYQDDKDVNKSREDAYITDNVVESLRLAQRFDKPVFPFIWHRYHNSNKKRGLQFISLEEFQNSVQTICEAEFKGNKVNGIVWWSSERYFYNITERGKANKRNPEDFYDYSNGTSLKYIDIILTAMKHASKNKFSNESSK